MTSRLPLLLAVLLYPGAPIGPSTARADASVPSLTVPAPTRYLPSLPLPAGFAQVPVVDCGGRPGQLDPDGDPAHCHPLPPEFIGQWRRTIGGGRGAAEVRVTSAPEPVTIVRPALKRWAMQMWPPPRMSHRDFERALKTGSLRMWQTPLGDYAVERVESFSCRECDPIWRLRRVQGGRGSSLVVEISVYGYPRAEEVAELRRAFVDGPLGAP